jgi:predicted phosphoribosyltransferase
MRRFRDRAEAGRVLAEQLRQYAGRDDVVVLGLPRGGVPVAFEVARALGAPLDVFLVRKLGVPGHEELAFGAIATGGTRVLNEEVVESLGIPLEWIEAIDAKERRELERRDRAYRGERPPPDLAGRTVILVDDGLATGSTMVAAVRAVREDDPARVVVAVPVADPDVCAALNAEADEGVCLQTPRPLRAVGAWYEDFSQTTDAEVRALLERSRRPPAADALVALRAIPGSAADDDELIERASRTRVVLLGEARGSGRVVVWEHNSHVGDARGTELGQTGELNVGQLARERHGAEALLVGFTTYTGTVTAASDWGAVAERKHVRRALPGSWEELFHERGVPRFVLDAASLRGRRLERAIGVVYRPETERISHYFHARLSDQFDVVVHLDETSAVEPLERTSVWEEGELPETYPWGV